MTDLNVKSGNKKLKDRVGRSLSTGLIQLDADFAINGSDPTALDVPAGRGQVVDNSDPDNPVVTSVSWPTTVLVMTNITTQPRTIVSVDVNGSFIQTLDRPKGSELRTQFMIGAANHVNQATIDTPITATRAPIINEALTTADFMTAIGAIEDVTDPVIVSPNGANLKFDASSGTFVISGENFVNDRANPNIIAFAGASPVTFLPIFRDGLGGFSFGGGFVDTLTPGKYDDGTVVGASVTPNGVVGDKEFQNFMLFLAPTTPVIAVHYGQIKYDSIIGARNGRVSEFNEATINPVVKEEFFLGFITVEGDATDLTDTTKADFGRFQSIDRFYDDVTELGDGIIYNIDVEIIEVSNGTTTTVEFRRSGAAEGDPIRVQLNGQSFDLNDDNIDNIVNLTHGTDTVPVTNFVFITEVAGKAVLQASTTKPTVSGVGLFANVKTYLVGSASFTQSDGFYNQDTVFDGFANEDQSHIRHVNNILRETVTHISGIDQTMTIGTQPTKDDLFIALTSGVVRILHNRIFSTKSNGGDIYVANDQTTAFLKITNLNAITTDTVGLTLESNNNSYNLIFFGTVNKDGTDSKLYVNKPTGKYSNDDANAVIDLNQTANTSLPTGFTGKSLLLYRVTVKFTNPGGGTLEILNVEDLRSVAVGGGGSVITQEEFSDATFRVFDNADPTKEIALQISGITTGTTRTLTPLDKDYTIGDVVGPAPLISNGTVAPTSTPAQVGDMFVDTVANKVYVATGTASSADWTILN